MNFPALFNFTPLVNDTRYEGFKLALMKSVTVEHSLD